MMIRNGTDSDRPGNVSQGEQEEGGEGGEGFGGHVYSFEGLNTKFRRGIYRRTYVLVIWYYGIDYYWWNL
jgi:hypothetical protein